MKFKQHIISSLLLAASLQAQTASAVEFTAAQEVAAITAQKGGSAPDLAIVEVIQVSPAPEYEAVDAEEQLENYLDKMGLTEGANDIKGRDVFVQVGLSSFDTKDPASDASFMIKRSLKAMEAKLDAKAKMIEGIHTTMSASEQVDVPGTDLNAQFNARKAENQARLEEQKKALVILLRDVDKKQADELMGVTFSDRYAASMDAAIKKIDNSYSSSNISAAKKAAYDQAKSKYESAKTEFSEIEKEINASAKVAQVTSSKTSTLSKMPLFGAITVNQFESWSKEDGYQIALLVMWSTSTEKMVRSMMSLEGGEAKKSPGRMSLKSWIKSQSLATMAGGRRFKDDQGNGWFIGIDSRALGTSSISKSKARSVAEMGAKKEVAMALFADMESKKTSESMMIENTDGSSEAFDSMAKKIQANIRNRSISGLQKIYGKKVVHPISGQKIYVAVYGMNSNTARKALAMQGSNYATQLLDIKSQQKLKGTKAGLNAAVRKAEQDKSAYHAAKQASQQKVEAQAASAAPKAPAPVQQRRAAPKNNRGSQAGVYGGGGADSFDW